MGAVALIEVLERDGTPRHGVAVPQWPLRVGRALDNDLVLDDPHVAPYHLVIDRDEAGAFVQVGETINGALLGTQQVGAGGRAAVGDAPLAITIGRVHLRLRLAEHALAPELRLDPTRSLAQGLPLLALLVLLVGAMEVFNTYLDTDPDGFVRALGSGAISALVGLLGWCGVWTLLSKLFTRQGHFGWHLRVALIAVLAWELISGATQLLSFSLSWPWLSDFKFVLGYAVGATLLYFHMLAVEPYRHRRVRQAAVAMALVGTALSLWFNWQNGDRLGSELYMSHLFPPALRVAKPVDTASFMKGVAELQATLDAKAKRKEDAGDDDSSAEGGGGDDD